MGYSVIFAPTKNDMKKSKWIVNWRIYSSLQDINWDEVEKFSKFSKFYAYGYQITNEKKFSTKHTKKRIFCLTK